MCFNTQQRSHQRDTDAKGTNSQYRQAHCAERQLPPLTPAMCTLPVVLLEISQCWTKLKQKLLKCLVTYLWFNSKSSFHSAATVVTFLCFLPLSLEVRFVKNSFYSTFKMKLNFSTLLFHEPQLFYFSLYLTF